MTRVDFAGATRVDAGVRGVPGVPRAVVLVTDGDTRAALAATRSLIHAGHFVYVAAHGAQSLAGASRGARPLVVDADPLSDPAAFARETAVLAGRVGARVVLPVTDASVGAVLHERALFAPGVVLPFPDAAVFDRASDKVAMAALANAAGLRAPESVTLASAADRAAVERFPHYPAVLKPHATVVAGPGATRRKLGVSIVDSAAQAGALLRRLPRSAFPVLLQERVHGPGEGVFLLRWNGEYLAEFGHRRLREIPPSGGVSVYRESIPVDPTLSVAARRLLDALDWQGVAMVECKRDLRNGRHVFMEVNGRLWGSLQLAIDAGVDFPALLVAAALGVPARAPADYRAGVRSRWFWGDMDHLYALLRHSGARLHLDGPAHSRAAAIASVFRYRPGRDRWEVERRDDPGPFLLETRRRLGLTR